MSNDGRIGYFRARVTRDGEAMVRDGQLYFAMNRLPELNPAGGDRDLIEIQFADGVWMLVREDDLVWGRSDVPDPEPANGLLRAVSFRIVAWCSCPPTPGSARRPICVLTPSPASSCGHSTRSQFSRQLGLHTLLR